MPSSLTSRRYAGALSLALLATANAGPCDIYASGGAPCIAAHSSTRALYASYNGPLYQLRKPDGTTADVNPLSAGGVANAATQDSFCSGTVCSISKIYDQSGHGNHLTQAPKGGAASGPLSNGDDLPAGAYGAPVTLNGQKAYGIFISPSTGYRNDSPSGTATGDNPESMYAVVDGTHYNDKCCFDYGNAETDNTDPGAGHMEAIYFGQSHGDGRGLGAGSGPWIKADLENGLLPGGDATQNTNNPTQTSRFVTAAVKGKPGEWAIRGGPSSSGSMATYWEGARPAGYTTMQKEGAIILGIGGDNSNWGQGTFYEGAMTATYASDETENAVQANIAAAKYAAASLNSGPTFTVGSTVSFRVTTDCCNTRYIAHTGDVVNTQVVSSSSAAALKNQASWSVRTGLGNSGCYSFESVDTPGSFIRHSGRQLYVQANDGSKLFHEDATFCSQDGINSAGSSLRSWSFPLFYWRHFNSVLYIAMDGGPKEFDATSDYLHDITFSISAGFA